MNIESDILQITDWFPEIKTSHFIIAGPCAAESREQLLETAEKIAAQTSVKFFRAGLWKPRTRPDSFEGVGEKALPWLQEVKQKTGLYTCVEVAMPQHVEACLKYGIDVLWLGARTTANPFSVQEIAETLKGTGIPVLIKNPVNPDIELWIGAVERLYKSGIKKIGAVLRGFYPYERTILRNIPKWELAIEMKHRIHSLPVLCDASHIAGNVSYIPEICQKALDLNFDGLMLETHINPKAALSDAMQQLTPNELELLISGLCFRKPSVSDPVFNNLLEQYRDQIDSIDLQMLDLLGERMKIVREIGKYKSKNNVTILQLRRWEKIIATRSEYGNKAGLSYDFIKNLLELVHKESIQIQTKIMSNPGL
ncbi:MAG TPA: 3-deoxy-7-phosphoheptulonate synthase [Bacteroidales bacterium]|nr:3-deoxy-7-phosphoheptulonate synthase [Bacteroidales bacterium]